jgi:hypothetical protein
MFGTFEPQHVWDFLNKSKKGLFITNGGSEPLGLLQL